MIDIPEISVESLQRHHTILYPSVRVRATKALGSGTVIYSKPEDPDGLPDEFETLVLTNHHVVADLIEVKEDWDSGLQRKRYREFRSPAMVEFFEFKRHSRVVSTNGKEAKVLAWDDKLDLALLRLETVAESPYVARLCPAERFERGIFTFDRVFTVGAALGEDPVVTEGRVAQFDRKIDAEPYLLTTAPSIFGNSGGAVYLLDTEELIGVPARIAVAGFGNAVTHLSYSIPITTVYRFLEEKDFQYIFDPDFTSKQCAATRERKLRASRDAQARPPDVNDPENRAQGGMVPPFPYGPDEDEGRPDGTASVV